MASPVKVRKLSDRYYQLVKQFPLARLRNDKDLDAAQEIIDRLLEQDLDDGALQYLDVLTDLVSGYEDEHHRIPDASEADVLRVLMQANKLSQLKLAKTAGIAQSTISAVLNGRRSLTKDQVVKLAHIFHVAPSAFLDDRGAV